MPTSESLLKGIENDVLDLEMAMTEEEKETLANAKENKTWRLLRNMAKEKLRLFNKADDGKKMDVFFQKDEHATDGGEVAPVPEATDESATKEHVNPEPAATSGSPGTTGTEMVEASAI